MDTYMALKFGTVVLRRPIRSILAIVSSSLRGVAGLRKGGIASFTVNAFPPLHDNNSLICRAAAEALYNAVSSLF